MRKMWKKSIALLCAFAMVFTLVPMQTQAATKKAAFTKSYTSLYENDTNKGVCPAQGRCRQLEDSDVLSD